MRALAPILARPLASCASAPPSAFQAALGRVPLLLGGWTLRVVVLLLLAFAEPNVIGVWALFVACSATLAVTEPAERLLIGDHADERERGTAFIAAAVVASLAAGLMLVSGARRSR